MDKTRWEHGKEKTLYFYRKKLPWKSKQFNREMPLPNYLKDLLSKAFKAKDLIGNKKEVAIAEIGSGMFCTIGSTWKGVKVKIYPSDILAEEYNQILKDCDVIPLVPIEKQNMEDLTYEDNFFDIVHCVNALDHTIDISKALREMYRVTKPGGYIYLRHFIDVAEKEGYYGMHMWNIDLDEKNECVFWNKDNHFLLTDYFNNVTSRKKREMEYENEDLIVSIIQK